MIIFKPNGELNVSREATDLPEVAQSGNIVSDAMQRCKNLKIDNIGRVELRNGSTRTNASELPEKVNFLVEQSGNRYGFAGAYIYENEVEIVTGLTAGAQWSAVKYNAFNDTTEQIYALNGTDRKRIESSVVYEWGVAAPTAAPTGAVGATTGLTGNYKAKYTYVRKVGSTVVFESNPSPAQESATSLSNESYAISFTAPTDAQITHIRIYRTLSGGGVYFLDQDVAVGATSVDSTTADIDLGGEPPTNHDRPPLGTVVSGPYYNGVVFIAKGNLLYYCLAKQPEYWPTTNFIEVGAPQFPIKAMVEFGGRVYCLTKAQIWLIQGTGTGSFIPIPLRSLVGAPNVFGAESIEGIGIHHIGPDGIYLFSGNRDRKITQDNFEILFRETRVQKGVDPILDTSTGTWLKQYENKLYFHYGSGNVLVFNLDNSRPTYYKYDVSLSAPVIDKQNERFYVGDDAKYVRRIEDSEVSTDIGNAIEWEVESKDFTLQTRRNFNRWAKWDVDASNATSATGNIRYDGSVHQTHTLTAARDTKRRLIKEGNGNRLSVGASGSGPIVIYGVETE